VYKIDEAVKIQKYMFFAIPVKAGIQVYQLFIRFPDSGFHRGDRFIFLNSQVLGFESALAEVIPVRFRAGRNDSACDFDCMQYVAPRAAFNFARRLP
jgi:hypothetical protein